MTFREIDEALLNLVDEETGEILDLEAFESLNMERDKKAEGMALWVLDLDDEIAALAKEIERLQTRKKTAANKVTSLKKYLQYVLDGQKLKTDTVSISYRKSDVTRIDDPYAVIDWALTNGKAEDVLKYAEPEVRKTEVKKLIDSGIKIPGVIIESNTSTIIK